MNRPATPVVLFVYNRPETTRKVVDALSKQTVVPKEIIVYADGPRNTADEDAAVRVADIIRAIDWTKVVLHCRPENLGSAGNIVDGLTQVFREFEQAVVVEDDILAAPHFYESMCILLDRYAREKAVFSVGGYPSVNNSISSYPYDVILSPRFSCWGWGTWADRWNRVAHDVKSGNMPYSTPSEVPTRAGSDLPYSLKDLEKRPGFYWDYPISLICLYNEWVHALTNYYLTNNIGLTSGVHGDASAVQVNRFRRTNQIQERLPIRFPSSSASQELVSTAIQDYLDDLSESQQSTGSVMGKMRAWIRGRKAALSREK